MSPRPDNAEVEGGELSPYGVALETIHAAEALEWQAAQLRIESQRLAGTSDQSGLIGLVGNLSQSLLVVAAGVILVAVPSSSLELAESAGPWLTVIGVLVILLAVARLAMTLFAFIEARSGRMRDSSTALSLSDDARFREQLAVDMIRPLRDYLALDAEQYGWSERETRLLLERLQRFPVRGET